MSGKIETNELIARVKNGDDDAFEELARRYAKLIASAAARYAEMGREYGDLREDLCQEASMALYRAAMSYDLSQSKVTFGLYAKTCVRNALVSQLRRLAAKPRSAGDASEKSSDDVEREVISEEMKRLLLRRAKGILSPLETSAIVSSMEGKPPRVAARELGVSAKTVSNALFRARRKLRDAPDILN